MSLMEIPTELISRSQSGDLGALNELLVKISPELRRLIYSQVRCVDDTDEILQEVLIRISKNIHRIREIGKFPAWAMRIVYNQCCTYFKSNKSPIRYFDVDQTLDSMDQRSIWAIKPVCSPRQAMIDKETRAAVDRAVRDLPPRQRSAFAMFELQQFSIREVSEAMNITEGAVKFNIHQARKKLKKDLSGYLKQSDFYFASTVG